MAYLKHYERNTAGRDFVVGDIHGFFSALQTKLDFLGFNPSIDRLFSVGDLVDRGPESELVTEWLAKPWFHAVRGNHDDFAIRHVLNGMLDPVNYIRNGGGWFLSLHKDEQVTIADALSTLPYAISIDCPQGKIGIVHAEIVVPTWGLLEYHLSEEKPEKSLLSGMMWLRSKIKDMDTTMVPDLYALVVGHTPVKHPVMLGNTLYADTSGGRNGERLSVINLHELEV